MKLCILQKRLLNLSVNSGFNIVEQIFSVQQTTHSVCGGQGVENDHSIQVHHKVPFHHFCCFLCTLMTVESKIS